MTLIDRAKRFFTRSAQWDAAGGGSRLVKWGPQPASVNQWSDNPIQLRARAEDGYRNNPWARRIVDSLNAAVIGGGGVSPQWQDRSVAQLWNVWSDGCDISGRLDWAGIEQLVFQTLAVSGEVFVRFVTNPDARVPLALQVLGPEFLDTSRVDSQNTYAGIRYAGVRPAGYWLFEQHPAMMAMPRSVFVPARECLHIFRPIHPGAQRGVSWLAPVLLPLRELQEYLEAGLIKAKVSALFAGYVISPDGSNLLKGPDGVPSLEPGTMARLQPGEDVKFTEPADVGAAFDPFVKSTLRKIAAGVGIPYEVLSGDLGSVTFASGRHGILEWARQVDSIQHVLMVRQFCAPVVKRWRARWV